MEVKNFKDTPCKRCGKRLTVDVVEGEYDFELRCFMCGEVWWVDKKETIVLKGDDLKYKSSSNIKRRGRKHKCQ